jgi:hypothetical protein
MTFVAARRQGTHDQRFGHLTVPRSQVRHFSEQRAKAAIARLEAHVGYDQQQVSIAEQTIHTPMVRAVVGGLQQDVGRTLERVDAYRAALHESSWLVNLHHVAQNTRKYSNFYHNAGDHAQVRLVLQSIADCSNYYRLELGTFTPGAQPGSQPSLISADADIWASSAWRHHDTAKAIALLTNRISVVQEDVRRYLIPGDETAKRFAQERIATLEAARHDLRHPS